MKTNLVAEIGINHNGSLKIAKQLIDLAILGGCKYVKFQKRTVEDVYTKEELDVYRESPWGKTNREQKNGLEFGKKEYDEIDRYCKEKEIGWFASPWDIKSVDFLMQYKPEFIKIASAMLTNEPLLDKVNKSVKGTNTKVIVAAGMCTRKEIENCVKRFGDKVEYILACTSSYPTPIEELNVTKMKSLKGCFGDDKKYGYSNHHSGIIGVIMAATLGANMIEYHITLDRTMYGSDQSASIETTGVLKIKDFVTAVEKGLGHGSIEIQPSEVPIREKLKPKEEKTVWDKFHGI